jgi:hypothetical protein
VVKFLFYPTGRLFLGNFSSRLKWLWKPFEITATATEWLKKCQRIAGLKALLKEWELSGDLDLDYIRGLKARLLSVQNQLKNMCGHDGSEGMDDW